jgi:hypothetical protein
MWRRWITIFLLTLTVFFTACGGEEPSATLFLDAPRPAQVPENHPEIRELLNEFLDMNRHNPVFVAGVVKQIVLVDNFANQPKASSGTVGLASYRSLNGKSVVGSGTIYLKQDFWEAASYETRKVLLWHECGHAYNNLDHTQDDTSIMSATVPSQLQLLNYWLDMVDAFLNQKR